MNKIPEKFLNQDGTLNSDALMKSYSELERKIGTMITVPTDGCDQDVINRFNHAIGVPETADEYPVNELFDDDDIRSNTSLLTIPDWISILTSSNYKVREG